MLLNKIFSFNWTKVPDGNQDVEALLRGYSLFNEADYLLAHPDVALAVSDGTFLSALQHFQLYGNAESRFPGYSGFNWDDYIKANADLADFRKDGDPEAKAKKHFKEAGYAEGRRIRP
ncbi:hypothetical protein [Rhizobium sp. Root483D2]|uniref:hypothetical protein n=1 Tax=Rhizobium sp. Root483D2 TaxID=1736545 RepID=UPI000714EFFC|nr:hypothetical protein [Rhizobium sp. Root483D2]KQY45685.1 hypothetical protein ASD32_10735 [Rhizobium sp. Root483D2]